MSILSAFSSLFVTFRVGAGLYFWTCYQNMEGSVPVMLLLKEALNVQMNRMCKFANLSAVGLYLRFAQKGKPLSISPNHAKCEHFALNQILP